VERSRPDYYRALQVDPAANPLVIQAAYRVLAQIWHPDGSGDDGEMKRINAAWEVLGDPRRRKQYDIERAGRHPGAIERPHEPAPSHPAPAPAGATAAAPSGVGSPPATPPRPTPKFRITRWSAKDACRLAGGVSPMMSADWLGQKAPLPVPSRMLSA
jgi:curved DNA-binding protein CbpA